jgi:hypothetical protein
MLEDSDYIVEDNDRFSRQAKVYSILKGKEFWSETVRTRIHIDIPPKMRTVKPRFQYALNSLENMSKAQSKILNLLTLASSRNKNFKFM